MGWAARQYFIVAPTHPHCCSSASQESQPLATLNRMLASLPFRVTPLTVQRHLARQEFFDQTTSGADHRTPSQTGRLPSRGLVAASFLSNGLR